jgi:UDP-N-acetylmuramoylalanine--D-glutamate ligase
VKDALEGVVPVIEASSMRQAVQTGYDAAVPEGVVLLAPACSSFDWFRDYAERGESFKAEVQELARKRGQ